MRRFIHARKAVLTPFGATALRLGVLPAAAASAEPLAASGCNQQVCMSVTTPSSNGSFTMTAWERYSGSCFYGHYQMGLISTNVFVNSSTRTWCWSNDFSYTFNLSQGKGSYCVIGWEYASGHYTNVGEPCENVS